MPTAKKSRRKPRARRVPPEIPSISWDSGYTLIRWHEVLNAPAFALSVLDRFFPLSYRVSAGFFTAKFSDGTTSRSADGLEWTTRQRSSEDNDSGDKE